MDVLRWIVIGGYASVLLAWGLIFCLWKFGLHEFILRLLASERAELFASGSRRCRSPGHGTNSGAGRIFPPPTDCCNRLTGDDKKCCIFGPSMVRMDTQEVGHGHREGPQQPLKPPSGRLAFGDRLSNE